MMEVLLCKIFKCKETTDCVECYNGVCSASEYEGFSNCGCKLCIFHKLVENKGECTYYGEEVVAVRSYDFPGKQ